MKRQGFALPLVVVITGVIACLGYIVHTLSRHHLLTIHHFADKERAYFLAQSSLQLGRSLLDDSVLFLNQSDALVRLSPPASLQPVLAPLIDAEGLIRSEEIDFFLAHPVLETIIRQNKDLAELKLKMVKTKGLPFALAASRGYLPDKREFSFQMQLRAVCIMKSGARSEVILSRSFRQSNVSPPLLGRFVLFLHHSADENPLIESSQEASLGGMMLNVHGSNPLTSPLSPADLWLRLDQTGWVYLGGSEWNLQQGREGDLEERQGAYLDPHIYYKDADPSWPLVAAAQANGVQLKKIVRFGPFYKELRLMGTSPDGDREVFNLATFDVDRGAFLNLMGNVQEPCPNLVFGSVKKVLAQYQGLGQVGKSPFIFPWLDASTFNSVSWPGGLTNPILLQKLKDGFGNSYDTYQPFMSRPVQTVYNSANLMALTSGTECSLITGSGSNLLEGSTASSFCQTLDSAITLKNDRNQILWQDAPLSDLQDLNYLKTKAGLVFANQISLKNWLKRNGTDFYLGSVVHLKDSLLISADTALAVGEGGMLLVDGDIEIRAPLRNPNQEPLTLVSLNGSIKIFTSLVQASLIALKGKIELQVKTRIDGTVAADRLFMNQSGALTSELHYTSSIDPAKSATFLKNFRLMSEETWLQSVL